MEFYKYFKLKPILPLVVVMLCVLSAVLADLIPNYSDPAEKVVYFDERHGIPLFLTCQSNPADRSYILKWEKNGKDVKNVPELSNRFNVSVTGLVIHKPTVGDAGKYKCINAEKSESAEIEVIANAIVEKLPAKTNVVRTTNVDIHCKVQGTDPKIVWSINGTEITATNNNNTRIKFKKDESGHENAILTIENIERTDENFYNCTATNKASGVQFDDRYKFSVAKTGTFVRVRGTVWGRVMQIPPFNWFT